MASMEFMIEGDVNVMVTVTEVGGNLEFNFHVIQPGEANYTGQIGELNGVFFDLAGDSTGTFSATTDEGESLTLESGDASVSNLGGGINMNGEVIKEDGKYDIGIVTDKTGLGNGDTQEITFTLEADYDLTLADVAMMDFGLRLTSVGDPEGERDGSLKLSGDAPEEPPIDDEEPPVDDEEPPVGDEEPPADPEGTNDALDDVIFAYEDAFFDGFQEVFTTGGPTILSNDVTDNPDGTTEDYTGVVTEGNGEAITEDFIEVPGTGGGLLRIYPDGTVDFSANGDFDALNDFETADTSFNYTIEGGDIATITVVVEGLSDGGGLDDGFGDGEDPFFF